MTTRAEIAEQLEALAEETGDDAFRRAARALFQQPAGRPPIDDDTHIRDALAMYASGEASTLNDAFFRIACEIASYANPRSIAERLRRKHAREKKVHEIVLVDRPTRDTCQGKTEVSHEVDGKV